MLGTTSQVPLTHLRSGTHTHTQVRPGPRAPPDFERQLGRSPPGSPSPGRPAPDYHVEDVPLSVLAGYPGVRGVPNFARMQPHAALFPGREWWLCCGWGSGWCGKCSVMIASSVTNE